MKWNHLPLSIFISIVLLLSFGCRGSRSQVATYVSKYIEAEIFAAPPSDEKEKNCEVVIMLHNKSDIPLDLKLYPSLSIIEGIESTVITVPPNDFSWIRGHIDKNRLYAGYLSGIPVQLDLNKIKESSLIEPHILDQLKEYFGPGLSIRIPFGNFKLIRTELPGLKFTFYDLPVFSWLFYLVLFIVIVFLLFLGFLFKWLAESEFVLSSSFLVMIVCLFLSSCIVAAIFLSANSVSILLQSPPSIVYLLIVFFSVWLLVFSFDGVVLINNAPFDSFLVSVFLTLLGLLSLTSLWSTKFLHIAHSQPVWLLAIVVLAFVMRIIAFAKGH